MNDATPTDVFEAAFERHPTGVAPNGTLFSPRQPIPVDEPDPELVGKLATEPWEAVRDHFRPDLTPLSPQARRVFALRSAKRVALILQLRDVIAEADAAGFEIPYDPAPSTVRAATLACSAEETSDAIGWAVCAARNVTPSATAEEVVRAAIVDLHRLRQIPAPLTGWDDPRLGPLWPDGPPEWHRKGERQIRELKDKLDGRPDPGEPPIPDEMLAQMQDARELTEKYNRGELTAYRGNHVLIYRGQIVGHGPDLSAVRKEVAERIGVPAVRLVTTFVYG